MKKVSIINFSGHHKGNGENISLYMSEYMKKKKIDVEEIGFSDINAHGCGICEYECFTKDRQCPYMEDGIVHIYKTIASSDFCFLLFLIIVTSLAQIILFSGDVHNVLLIIICGNNMLKQKNISL